MNRLHHLFARYVCWRTGFTHWSSGPGQYTFDPSCPLCRFIRSVSVVPGVVLVVIATCHAALCADLIGQARVVDGDTIAIAGTHVRLWGIDAVEHDQTCQAQNGSTWACGAAATAALRSMIGVSQVSCTPRDLDRYGRTVAVCRSDRGDLNASMVRSGFAVDWKKYSHGAYHLDEEEARTRHLGIWAGSFELPEQWRREHHR